MKLSPEDSPIFDDKFIPRPDPGGNLRPIVPLSTHGSSLHGSRPSTPRSSLSRFSTHTTVEDRDTAKGIALVENAKSPTVHSSVPASSKKNDSGSWFIRFIRFLTMCVHSKEHEDASEVENPWIKSVFVLSKEQNRLKNFIPKEAICIIDTGNSQGNTVSKDFCLQTLKFTEADFKPLTTSEQKDGFAMNSGSVTAVAAVELSWYRETGVKVFRDMRFLVLEETICDMTIGAKTIAKHKLLNEPNFGVVASSNRGRERERYNQVQARKAARKAKLNAEYAKAKMEKREGPLGTRPSNAPTPASDLQPSVSIEQDECASDPDIAIYVRSATMEN